jgi:hypothetical protein
MCCVARVSCAVLLHTMCCACVLCRAIITHYVLCVCLVLCYYTPCVVRVSCATKHHLFWLYVCALHVAMGHTVLRCAVVLLCYILCSCAALLCCILCCAAVMLCCCADAGQTEELTPVGSASLCLVLKGHLRVCLCFTACCASPQAAAPQPAAMGRFKISGNVCLAPHACPCTHPPLCLAVTHTRVDEYMLSQAFLCVPIPRNGAAFDGVQFHRINRWRR